MVRPIDADAYARDMHELNERLYRWYLLAKDEDVRQRANGAIALLDEVRFMLDEQPTVDAPVVHGHWDVHEDTYGDDEAKCSVCGFEMAVNQPGNGLCMVSELNYCPCCGAKMDLLDDDTKWEVTENGVKVTKYNCTKEEIEDVKAIMEEKVTNNEQN